jgi:hypothetical protein
MEALNRHSTIVKSHERAKYQLTELWEQLHTFLAAEFDNGNRVDKKFIFDTFQKYPFVIHKLSRMEWNQDGRRRSVTTDMIRGVIYVQLKRINAVVNKLKKKILISTRFNAFTFMVYRAYGKNLDFTRSRVMQCLH